MTVPRRFLLLAALLFWQGGLTFYGAVVIPIGARVLGSHREQAVITREVALVLQCVSLVTWGLFAWDNIVCRDPRKWRQRCRHFMKSGIVLTWCALGFLYMNLNKQFDPEKQSIVDISSFRFQHRLYLWILSVQWLLCVSYLVLTLQAWRAEDTAAGEKVREDEALGSPHFGVTTEPAVTLKEVRKGKEEGMQLRREEKSSAVDIFGVAQSPKSPYGGTKSIVHPTGKNAIGNFKKITKIPIFTPSPHSMAQVPS